MGYMSGAVLFLTIACLVIINPTEVDGAGVPAVAPAPSGKTSPCALPNGMVIDAPQATGTANQYITYYYTYSWTYYSYYYTTYYYYGRKLLQGSNVPSPSSAPACCQTTTTSQGDTVTSLISSAGLPADSKSFFYAINPQIKNGTDNIPAGAVVTVPCFRITEYYRLNAPGGPVQAPVQMATTGK